MSDDDLLQWFSKWKPPAEPFSLAPHLTVSDPALWTTFYRAEAARAKGHCRRVLLLTLRLLKAWENGHGCDVV